MNNLAEPYGDYPAGAANAIRIVLIATPLIRIVLGKMERPKIKEVP